MLSPGDIIKKSYKIEKILGKGGMGAVYYCSEISEEAQIWAIKEMNIPTTDPDLKAKALKHFETEADILSRLSHFNLPGVKEYFQENNSYYLVMEYIEGESLGKLLDKSPEPFSEELVLKWGTQLATVIYFLHIQNPKIIYRDLKPSNIIIDLRGNVKLIDFGIARFFRSDKKKDTVQMGSIGYAPPEQFGQGQTDERSDIYSLGVTLHQLLTKRDPADAENPFDIPLLRKLNNNASIELERIIQRATQFEAERRYQKAIEIKRDLKILYDEKQRKSKINFPVPSNQPPTIAISPEEMVSVGISAESSNLKQEKTEMLQDQEEPRPMKEEKKEKNNLKEEDTIKEKISETAKEEKNKNINKPAVSQEITTGKQEKEEKSKNSTLNRKKISPLKFVFNLIIIILILSISGILYYLYQHPDKTPAWLMNYISISDKSPTTVPVAIETPTMIPTQDPDFFKDQAFKKYNEKNYEEAKNLLEESLKISLYDPEVMILNSNIDLSLNNMESFSIGLVTSRSGNMKEEGKAMMRGAFIALQEINSDWGIRGKMLRLELIDDESNLNSILNLFDKSYAEDLSALIGPMDYVMDMAIAPLTEEKNILYISPSLPAGFNRSSNNFGISPDIKSEIKAMKRLIYEIFKKNKIALIYDIQNPYFLELNYIFKEEILSGERNIIEILFRGERAEEQTEIDRVASIVSKEEPEIVVFLTSPGIIKKLAAKIRKVNENFVFLGGHWAYSGLLLDDPELDGCLSLCPVAEGEDKIFKGNYKKLFPDTPLDFSAIQAYDSIKLITDSINIKGFVKEDLETYLMNFDEKNYYKGQSGNIYFNVTSEENDRGKWKVIQIINGQFHDLYSI